VSTQITVSVPRPAPFFAPIFVAIDKGFFAAEGIEANLRFQTSVEQLMRREVDFAFGSAVYNSMVDSSPATLICGHSTRETSHVLMIRPGVDTVDRLEHVLLPGDAGPRGQRFVSELRNILGANGLDFDQAEISTQNVPGSHKEQWQMLQEGIGDAATLGAPWFFFAAKQGYTNAGHEPDYSPGVTGSSIYAHPDRVAQDPSLVQAFIRAYVRSMRYCQQNVPGTLETLMKFSHEWGVTDEEIAQAAYDDVSSYWKLEIDVDALTRMSQEVSVQRGLPPIDMNRSLDLSFLTQALRA
jgi:ABC-type nitrate/sulfonate/bicarbonate transport system substrate-binding protein